MSERTLESCRRAVAAGGPYRVSSCANDAYRVERVAVHCKRHEKAKLECDDCAMAGSGLFTRLDRAEAIQAVLNARVKRARSSG